MSEDTFSASGEQALPAAGPPSRRARVDHLELNNQWIPQAEEQQVEQALALYAQAARQRMQDMAPEQDSGENLDEEALEARSQQLRLQQKGQDIAALMLVGELEDILEDELEE